jgi:two-component system sensor histidine kinase/response regulator
MPGLNGFEVAAAIKDSGFDEGLTVLMLTSDHWADASARTYELGLGGYLVKPVRRADPCQAINIALGRSKGAAPTFTGPAHGLHLPITRSLAILLVDDSGDKQLLLQSYLKPMEHRLEVADNGAIALEKVKHGRYGIILMDVHSPVMDGYAATQASAPGSAIKPCRQHASSPSPP